MEKRQNTTRITIYAPAELAERVWTDAGPGNMSAWIIRAIEQRLERDDAYADGVVKGGKGS